jgi:RNA polymerase sigma-70 factor (ECF subfamily)
MASRLTDEELARCAAAGSLECFEELLVRYRVRVYGICFSSAGNAEDAEDWAQESFVRVYRQLGRFDPSLPFAPWLLRVVSNTCVNLSKARARRQDRLELGLSEETEGLATVPDPIHAALSGEEVRAVFAEVEALAPPLREALVLRVVEGLSFRELSEALGVPLQTAATRVRRALALVRERLAHSGIGVDR